MSEFGVIAHTVLTATAPFDLTCSLRAVDGFTPCSGDQFVLDGRVRKAFLHPTDPTHAVVTEITARDDGVPGVHLTVRSDEPLTPDELASVGARVTDWLSLDDDRTGFLRTARADPGLARVLAVAEGLHQVRFATLAEGATYFTLTQHSTQWFATARKRRLTADLGPSATIAGRDYTAFPALSTVTALGEKGLIRYAGSPARATRLATVLTGLEALDEAWLRTGPYDEVLATLLAVKGIGKFTAHALLLRVLGRPDAVPLEMDQFTKTARTVYGDPPPPPATLRERYGPWVGWWAYTCRTALGWLDEESRARARAARPQTRPSRSPRSGPRARATSHPDTAPRRTPEAIVAGAALAGSAMIEDAAPAGTGRPEEAACLDDGARPGTERPAGAERQGTERPADAAELEGTPLDAEAATEDQVPADAEALTEAWTEAWTEAVAESVGELDPDRWAGIVAEPATA